MNVVTTKVPPGFDGRTLWSAYEEAIAEWCHITELDPTKRGPALRPRLDGEAAIYKPMLDRDKLVTQPYAAAVLCEGSEERLPLPAFRDLQEVARTARPPWMDGQVPGDDPEIA